MEINDTYLYALNPNGTLKWRYETWETGSVPSSPAIGADGIVYVGSRDQYLYALNPDGTLKWRYETGSSVSSSPAICVDGTVYVGSWDHSLYALNPDGSLKWRYETGSSVYSSPAIGPDGTIYVGSNDSYVYAFHPDGTLKWRYETGETVYSSPSVGPDGTVYVGSRDNYLYALNPEGSLKWRYETGDGVNSSPAIGADSTVYVGSWDNYLYALNPDGSLKWRYLTGRYVSSSPAVGADGTVYVGSNDNFLYALNPNGILKWRYATEDYVYSSPAIGTDGTVYVGSGDGYLYAIETNCGGLANSPWPMRGNNAQHTGMYPIPFYCSLDEFTFQALNKDYTGDMFIFGKKESIHITSCNFTHPGFCINISLPAAVNAGQSINLPYTIQVGSTAVFSSICTLDWQSGDNSGEFSLQLSQGIIYKDNSETDVIGSQVLAAYNSSIAKDPQSIATKNNLALLFRICGEPERADQILSAIEKDALDNYYCADVYLLNRGVTQSDLNQSETAAICFNGVLSNESEAMSTKAWYNCGWEEYQQAEYNQAILYTDSVLASPLTNEYTLAKAWCLRGAALLGLGQKEDAEAAFTQAENLDPNGPIGAMARENLLTGVDDNEDKIIPARFELYANYPNPFNPSTTIAFDLPQAGEVSVTIFNTLGRQVRRLHQGLYPAGRHTLKWNALDDKGCTVSSGIYVLKVTTNDEIKVKKLTLMR